MDRLGLWVDGSGFGARWVVLGHGGLGSGIEGGGVGLVGRILDFGGLLGPGHEKIDNQYNHKKK